MREDDDAQQGTGEGSLADGLGETETEYSSSSEPFGDDDFDGSYDDSYDDDSSSDSSTDESDGSVVIYDETDDTGSDEADDGDVDSPSDESSAEDDGGYGDGDDGGDVVIYESDDQVGDDPEEPSDDAAGDGTSLDDGDLLPEDASPLEGVGYLLEQVRDALLGEGDDDASAGFDTDPAELATGTDLDLNGDSVVDGADLHEAASSLDFEVDEGDAGGADGGVFDA